MDIEFVAAGAALSPKTALARVVYEGVGLDGLLAQAAAASRFTGAKGQTLDILAPSGVDATCDMAASRLGAAALVAACASLVSMPSMPASLETVLVLSCPLTRSTMFMAEPPVGPAEPCPWNSTGSRGRQRRPRTKSRADEMHRTTRGPRRADSTKAYCYAHDRAAV